jgi:hypothetical protein
MCGIGDIQNAKSYEHIASSLFGVGGNDRSCLSTDVFRFG